MAMSTEITEASIRAMSDSDLIKLWHASSFSDATRSMAFAEILRRNLDVSDPSIREILVKSGHVRPLTISKSSWSSIFVRIFIVLIIVLVARTFFGSLAMAMGAIAYDFFSLVLLVAAEARVNRRSYAIATGFRIAAVGLMLLMTEGKWIDIGKGAVDPVMVRASILVLLLAAIGQFFQHRSKRKFP